MHRSISIIFVFCIFIAAGCAKQPTVDMAPGNPVAVVSQRSFDRQSLLCDKFGDEFRDAVVTALSEKGMAVVEESKDAMYILVLSEKFVPDKSGPLDKAPPLVTSSNPILLPVELLFGAAVKYGPDAYDAIAGVDGEIVMTVVLADNRPGGVRETVYEDDRDHFEKWDEDDLSDLREDLPAIAAKIAARLDRKIKETGDKTAR